MAVEIRQAERVSQKSPVQILDTNNPNFQKIAQGIIAACNDSWTIQLQQSDGTTKASVKYAHPTLPVVEEWEPGGHMFESIKNGTTTVAFVEEENAVVSCAMLVYDEENERYELGRYFSKNNGKGNGHSKRITNRLLHIAQEKGVKKVYFDRAWNRTGAIGALNDIAEEGFGIATVDLTPSGTYGDDESNWGCIGLELINLERGGLEITLPDEVPDTVRLFAENLQHPAINPQIPVYIRRRQLEEGEYVRPTLDGRNEQKSVDIRNITELHALVNTGYAPTSILSAGDTHMVRMVPTYKEQIPEVITDKSSLMQEGASPLYTTRNEELQFIDLVHTVIGITKAKNTLRR